MKPSKKQSPNKSIAKIEDYLDKDTIDKLLEIKNAKLKMKVEEKNAV